jgi:hypothetical protein
VVSEVKKHFLFRMTWLNNQVTTESSFGLNRTDALSKVFVELGLSLTQMVTFKKIDSKECEGCTDCAQTHRVTEEEWPQRS